MFVEHWSTIDQRLPMRRLHQWATPWADVRWFIAPILKFVPCRVAFFWVAVARATELALEEATVGSFRHERFSRTISHCTNPGMFRRWGGIPSARH